MNKLLVCVTTWMILKAMIGSHVYILPVHFKEMFIIGKSIETEIRLVVN